MLKPTSHLFVCGAISSTGEKSCRCNSKAASELLEYLKHEVSERVMPGVAVTACECMGFCEHSPVVIVYPEGSWYGQVDTKAAGEILDSVRDAALTKNSSGCSGCHR